MLEKLNLFRLTGQIALVLLMWRWMDLFLRKNNIFRCWGCLSLLNWTGAFISSLLLKLPLGKLEPWFILYSVNLWFYHNSLHGIPLSCGLVLSLKHLQSVFEVNMLTVTLLCQYFHLFCPCVWVVVTQLPLPFTFPGPSSQKKYIQSRSTQKCYHIPHILLTTFFERKKVLEFPHINYLLYFQSV